VSSDWDALEAIELPVGVVICDCTPSTMALAEGRELVSQRGARSVFETIRIVRANTKLRRLLGDDPPSVDATLDLNVLRKVFSASACVAFSTTIVRACNVQGSAVRTLHLEELSGRVRSLRIHLNPIPWDAQKAWIISIHDVTRQANESRRLADVRMMERALWSGTEVLAALVEPSSRRLMRLSPDLASMIGYEGSVVDAFHIDSLLTNPGTADAALAVAADSGRASAELSLKTVAGSSNYRAEFQSAVVPTMPLMVRVVLTPTSSLARPDEAPRIEASALWHQRRARLLGDLALATHAAKDVDTMLGLALPVLRRFGGWSGARVLMAADDAFIPVAIEDGAPKVDAPLSTRAWPATALLQDRLPVWVEDSRHVDAWSAETHVTDTGWLPIASGVSTSIIIELSGQPRVVMAGEALAVLAEAVVQLSAAVSRLEAEQKVRMHDRQMRAVFEHSPLAMLHLGVRGSILRLNQAAARLLDLADGNDANVGTLTVSEDRGRLAELLARAGAGEGEASVSDEVRLAIGDQVIVAQVSVSRVEDEAADDSGRQLVMVVDDVTRLKAAEEDLRNAREAAEVASRAKSTFLAHVSHEIRTPIAAILGFAQLLHRDPELTPTQAERLERILRAGDHLTGLIDGVLEVSKIESGHVELELESFNLPSLLSDVEAMFRARATDKGLELLFQVGDIPFAVRSDPGKLRQILINLIGNAIKFTDVGSVRVEARSERSEEHVQLFFTVVDTGPGIPPENLERIYERFVSSANWSAPGTGLGLAICKEYVDLLGGRVTVHSEVGRGSTFAVEVPVAQVLRAPRRRRVQTLRPSALQSLKALVVDDNDDNRDLLTAMLSAMGIKVKQASGGLEALQRCQEARFHLVFMDLAMPDLDGIETTRELHRRGLLDRSKIVAVSAHAFNHDRRRAMEAGVDAFMTKPFTVEQLDAVLTRLVKGLMPSALRREAVTLKKLSSAPRPNLTPIGSDMLRRLRQAANDANVEGLRRLTDELSQSHQREAIQIVRCVEDFRYDQVLTLVDKWASA